MPSKKGKQSVRIETEDQTKLQQDSVTTTRTETLTVTGPLTITDSLTFQQKGIGIVRIVFGVAWAVAAVLKWQPAFIQSFADTVGGASQGQPTILQAWLGLWHNVVQINPTGFGFLPALVESLLALCFISGAFTNSAALIGMVWSFTIWSVPESFGGPYVPGQSTDIGTAFPYLLLCVLMLLLSSGR